MNNNIDENKDTTTNSDKQIGSSFLLAEQYCKNNCQYNIFDNKSKDCPQHCFFHNPNQVSERKTNNLKNSTIFVKFKGRRIETFYNFKLSDLNIGDKIIISCESGLDMGTIIAYKVCPKENSNTQDNNDNFIVRKATDKDIEINHSNQLEEEEIKNKTAIIAESYEVEMKVIDVEWQWDKHKLTIFFTAAQRIDFRELVKDLARQFKARIELRQINTREEIKRIGDGVGGCGQKLCCVRFLDDFTKVSVEHAKLQQLSNNASKLSGNCRRIKCCMGYEYEFYEKELEKYPPINSTIETKNATLKLNKIDIFKNEVTLYNTTEKIYETMPFLELEKLMKDGKVIAPIQPIVVDTKLINEDEDLIIEDEF
jgi:cell fate regulator YaaT (PSP1 superfamily)